MNGITIRPVRSTDASALAPLSGELGYPTSTEAEVARLSRMAGAPDHRVLVAETPEGRVVGWIHVFGALRVESDPFAELCGLVVAADYRGRGIGRSLVAAAETWARSSGYRTLRLRSRVTREDAHRLYVRLGFERTKSQHVFSKRIDAEAAPD